MNRVPQKNVIPTVTTIRKKTVDLSFKRLARARRIPEPRRRKMKKAELLYGT
jgi:hypothetical protein